jgi:DNA invertase Pin-like site-specific DNA recombinase
VPKCALYARVSTAEDLARQDPETQLVRLREWASALEMEVHEEYIDRASGADQDRPALKRMLQDARKRAFTVILIVRLDRAMRSTKHLLDLLEGLSRWKVGLRCLDQAIETDSAEGRLVITIIAAVAEFERELIAARVRDGMARAKAEGKHVGRPKVDLPAIVIAEAERRVENGESLTKVAKDIGISRRTLSRVLDYYGTGQKGGSSDDE